MIEQIIKNYIKTKPLDRPNVEFSRWVKGDKKLLICLVHMYKKYAPEEIRRSCLCYPTCSDYAVQAVEKYGSFIGLKKTFERLCRCTGKTYKVDLLK